VIGDRIGHWMPAAHLKLVADAGFIAIGLWMLLSR
jgi:hypothetical protein